MEPKDALNLGTIVGTTKKLIEIDVGRAIMKVAKQIDECRTCAHFRYELEMTLVEIIKYHFRNHLIEVDENE